MGRRGLCCTPNTGVTAVLSQKGRQRLAAELHELGRLWVTAVRKHEIRGLGSLACQVVCFT